MPSNHGLRLLAEKTIRFARSASPRLTFVGRLPKRAAHRAGQGRRQTTLQTGRVRNESTVSDGLLKDPAMPPHWLRPWDYPM